DWEEKGERKGRGAARREEDRVARRRVEHVCVVGEDEQRPVRGRQESRVRVAEKVANGSAPPGGPRTSAAASACAWASGSVASRPRIGRSRSASPEYGRLDSASCPQALSRSKTPPWRRPTLSSVVLPTPGSP